MNSTGRTGSQAARAATLLAPRTAAAVNAVDKTERYIGLSRQILFRRSMCRLYHPSSTTSALVSSFHPLEIDATIAGGVVVQIVGICSEHGIRVFGLIGNRIRP